MECPRQAREVMMKISKTSCNQTDFKTCNLPNVISITTDCASGDDSHLRHSLYSNTDAKCFSSCCVYLLVWLYVCVCSSVCLCAVVVTEPRSDRVSAAAHLSV